MSDTYNRILPIALLLSVLPAHAQQIPFYRPGQEYRSLNTAAYEIAIQKNGRLDVVLVSGEPMFTNAFPMVWIEGEDAPKFLPIDGRKSARLAVDDRLGRGQGMVLQEGPCEWHLRVYPATSFFAVQVAYTNTSRKPVTIKALLPWVVGPPKKGEVWLGPGTAESRILAPQRDAAPHVTSGSADGYTHLAVANPATGRSLVLGFITTEQSQATVQLEHEDDAAAFTSLRAMCTYDPPVTLAPGEQLRSGVLYLAIAESNPFDALERYAAAVTVSGGAAVGALDMNAPYAQPVPMVRWQAAFPDPAIGVVEAVRTAARRYYLSPRLTAHPIGAIDAAALSEPQTIAALTAQAMMGGPVETVNDDGKYADVVEKLAPVARRRARPIDLFAGDVARVWALPVDSAVGDWAIAAVFNWNPIESQRVTLSLPALGLDPGTRYTVFDFWRQEYYGIAQGSLFVDADPASVRVLGFRRYHDRPMLLASDTHFTMGALEHTALSWDGATLSGTFDAVAGKAYTLSVLAPEPFDVQGVQASAAVEHAVENSVVRVRIDAANDGAVTWSVAFSRR